MSKGLLSDVPCTGCGGPVLASNRYGICTRNAECKKARGRAQVAALRIKDPKRYSQVQQAYRNRHPGTARLAVAVNSAKTRARRLGVPFTLTREDLPPIPDMCPVLGIPLVLWGNGYQSRDSSPSLDRIRPELGYIPGNVAWISTRANILRRDASADELFAVAKYVEGL